MRKIFSVFIVIALLSSVLSGCGTEKEPVKLSVNEIKYNTVQSVGTVQSKITDNKLVDENEYVAFYYDEQTSYIYVFDKRTEKIWCSNPIEASSADEKSQILLSVRDKSGTQTTYTSYTDAVAKKQVEYVIDSGKLTITYTIGYANDLLGSLPLGFTAERFEEILARCDKKQANLLEKRYRENESTGNFERKEGLTQNQTQKLAELFDAIGYTDRELEKDNESFENAGQDSSHDSFAIKLNVWLEQDSLLHSVDASQIESKTNKAIEKLTIFPYFGCLQANADGYIFVPDGSGAIINTNLAFEASGLFTAPFYGYDSNYFSDENMNSSNKILLPVFGLNRGKDGLLTIIEEGKAIANINASKPGITGNVAFANASFAIDVVQDLSVSGNASSKYVASSTKRYDGEIKQRIIFLTKDYCDYSGMAKIYRNYLLENKYIDKKLENEKISFHLETIGTITDDESTLGFVHETYLPLTKYEDNITLLSELKSEGITDVKLVLSQWFNGGADQKLADDTKLISKLGGKKGFKKLINYCNDNNIGLYPTVYLSSFSKANVLGGNKYAAVDLAYDKVYNMMSGYETDFLFNEERYVLSPKYIYGVSHKFLGDYTSKYKTGLSLGDIASNVYSDLKKTDTILRSESLEISETVVKDYSEKLDLLLSAPNDVSVKYADNFTNIPNKASSYLCEESSVPFYQMVFHGYREYSSEAINQTSNADIEILKCIEYGAVPKFSWIYDSALVKAHPQRSALYYADYEQWFSTAVNAYKEISSFLSDVRNCTIEKHTELESQVFKVVYSNNTVLYINYNNSAVSVEGVNIPAMSAMRGGN